MAVLCNPDALVADAKCISTCIPDGSKLAVLISLFCKVAGMNCDPDSLVSDAKCIITCIPPGLYLPILVNLACQIANNGGGGGGQDLFIGHYGGNAPNITPTASVAVARDLDAPNVVWWWDGSTWS